MENTFYVSSASMCVLWRVCCRFGEKEENGRVSRRHLFRLCVYEFTHKCHEKERKLKIQQKFRLNETINEASLALMMSLKINFCVEEEDEKRFFCVLPISGISSMRWFGWKMNIGPEDNKPNNLFAPFQPSYKSFSIKTANNKFLCTSQSNVYRGRNICVYTRKTSESCLTRGEGGDDDDETEKRTFLLLFICLIIFQSFLWSCCVPKSAFFGGMCVLCCRIWLCVRFIE